MSCKFVAELSKLRKLSQESVENTRNFDDFKKYLHVVRPVETELRFLLEKVNREGKKCLVMLCGSAGDGKSHLMSYLRNADQEHLLDSFELYNDATESSAPLLTSMDTLAEKLSAFNDENYKVDDGYRMILAINLGTLNNFIESEQGKGFSKLKQYVELNDIFSTNTRPSQYQRDSVFQHVSFSDYQIFTLRENSVGTEYLEELISRVFRFSDENPFYRSYTDNKSCTLCQKCPVRHNFEFLSEPKHQKAVIRRIVEVVIKDKAIISTREVLNFLYDIIVHPSFDYSKMCRAATSETKYLTYYIQDTTPMLMYEFNDISPLINSVRKHDLLKNRQAEMDIKATRFHALENIYDSFKAATNNTPYEKLNDITNIALFGGIKPELKRLVFRFIVRTKELKNEYPQTRDDQLFSEFIQYLYYQNSGQEKKLSNLYKATKKAVMSWDGPFGNDDICIDDTNDKYWVLEQLLIKPALYKTLPTETSDVSRFSTSLKLRFKKDSDSEIRTAEISMDYSLFRMICAMRDGYRPTVQDKNQHTDFVSFVQQLIEFGNKSNRVVLISKDNEHGYKAIFEETDFGYEFKVVKL